MSIFTTPLPSCPLGVSGGTVGTRVQVGGGAETSCWSARWCGGGGAEKGRGKAGRGIMGWEW